MLRRLLFFGAILALFMLWVLRLFRNRWAQRTMQKLWLAVMLYMLVIFGLGIYHLIGQIQEGKFP